MKSIRSALLLLSAALPACLAGAALAEGGRSLTGTATYLARIALPPEAELSVEAQDFSGRSLAFARRATDGAQVPLGFELKIPASVSAELRVAISFDGGVRWLSDPVGITPGAEPVALGELLLHPYSPMGFSSEMLCGSERFRVGFAGEKALIDTGSGVIELGQAIAASGARFLSADGQTEFWTKGNSASLTLAGRQLPECSFVPPEPPKAWRASGNEPFWALEISGGRATLTGPDAEPLSGTLPEPTIVGGAFRYYVKGMDLAISVSEQICRDTMTGMPHPQQVTMLSGSGEGFMGCGGAPLKLLTGAEWQIEDIGGGGIIDRSNVTLQVLPGGQVAGSAGCNRFTGALVLTGEGLSVGPVAGTMMACPESLMAQEGRFHQALGSVDSFDIDETGALHLKSGGETVLLGRR